MNDDLEEYRHGMPQWPKHLREVQEKLQKYQQLAYEIQERRPGNNVNIILTY